MSLPEIVVPAPWPSDRADRDTVEPPPTSPVSESARLEEIETELPPVTAPSESIAPFSSIAPAAEAMKRDAVTGLVPVTSPVSDVRFSTPPEV